MLVNEDVSTIVELTKKRIELFKVFMQISQQMLLVEFDELVVLDEQRQDILNQIKAFENEIKQIYEKSSDADYISRILKNQENRGDIPQEYLEIFDVSQEMLGLVYHIRENEVQVLNHLNSCKDKLMEQMRENQQSSKIVGYLKVLDQKMVPDGSLLSSNSRNA